MTATRFPSPRSSRSRGRYPARHAESAVDRSPLAKRPIKSIWTEYRRTRDVALRNFLMEKYLHLVRYNAERLYTRLPDEVDIEDLMSAGMFGLMNAINAFDLGRNVKFETYCAPRIRGAILDELRAMDWVPRLVRHRSAKVEAARQQIEKETGVPATDQGVAQRLGVDYEEFKKIERDSSAVSTVSLTRRASPGDGARETRDIDVARPEHEGPVRGLHRKDLRELITRGLTRAERLIVILYYYEGMTMKEIGATLDLSESRVSQMHSLILARLKAQMTEREPELEPVE